LYELKRALRGEDFDYNKLIKVSDERSYYNFFEDLKGLSSVEAISLFVRETARTPKQEVVARCLHAQDIEELSLYNQCHALRIHVVISFACGDLSIELAKQYFKDLDRLQRVVTEERGWYFNPGDIPDSNFTMIFLGSYCTDNKNPANFELRNHPAFRRHTRELILQVCFDNGLDASAERIDRMISEIFCADKVDICHSAHYEEKDYRLRQKKYNSELEAAAKDFGTTVDGLFFGCTLRVTFQTLILKSLGLEEPHVMTMSSLYNDQFKLLAKATDFESTLRTALLKSSGRTFHNEMDKVHGYGNVYSDTIIANDRVFAHWVSRNDELRRACEEAWIESDSLECNLMQISAKIYKRHPQFIKDRDAEIKERAKERGNWLVESKQGIHSEATDGGPGHYGNQRQRELGVGAIYAPSTDGGPGHYGNQRHRELGVGAIYAPSTDGRPGNYGNQRQREIREDEGWTRVPMISPGCPGGHVKHVLVDKNLCYCRTQLCDHCRKDHANYIPEDAATRDRFGISEVPRAYGRRPKWEERFVSDLCISKALFLTSHLQFCASL
jgi:hypothetical protein